MGPKLWKLTKATVSLLRSDKAGVLEAQKAGFVLQGECDQDGNIIDAQGTPFTDEQPKQASQPKKAKK